MSTEEVLPLAPDGPMIQAWFAVMVKPRAEKAVAEALLRKGYESFLPLYASQREWSDRCKTIHLPGIVGFVSLGPDPTPIEPSEIDGIRLLLRAGMPVGPWPYLREGQQVEVTRGVLKGIRGILLKAKSQLRLVLSVNLLQRSVAVEVDRDDVRPVL
jgi:transcription antitermination factor NusG